MRFRFVMFFILTFYLLFGCNKKSDLKNTQIIENSESPKYSTPILKFEEDLVLSEPTWAPDYFTVDEEVNIYFFQTNSYVTIYKYERNGSLLLKKRYQRGEGPSDIFIPRPIPSFDGRIWMYDKPNHRIVVLNKDLEIEKTMQLDHNISPFLIDRKFNIYAEKFELKLISKGKIPKSFKKFSPDLKKDNTIFQLFIDLKTKDEKDGSYLLMPYSPFGILKIDRMDNIYFAVSDKYKITQVSSNGELIKKIIKKASPRPLRMTEEVEKKTQR